MGKALMPPRRGVSLFYCFVEVRGRGRPLSPVARGVSGEGTNRSPILASGSGRASRRSSLVSPASQLRLLARPARSRNCSGAEASKGTAPAQEAPARPPGPGGQHGMPC
ncbi:hypothetical protein NDU88_001797 [Pleurodeles waltl]|uniref:Uncharacterized protein n=1 Tax=Pleurodeles waltl TaxID=8319 RepID=A0AAV7VXS7_PLEWA|nr:hypothetical protein NDU88_001797 [Pleurodeles waltl]